MYVLINSLNSGAPGCRRGVSRPHCSENLVTYRAKKFGYHALALHPSVRAPLHVNQCDLSLFKTSFPEIFLRDCQGRFTACIFDIGRTCYVQLIPVQTRYPLISITQHIAGLCLELIEITCFLKLTAV